MLIPRQPYQILLAEQCMMKNVLKYGISHFYEYKVGCNVSEITTAVPDGCIDIMFYWSDDFNKTGADVTGTVLRPHSVKIHEGCNYFGVRFYPGQRLLFDELSFSETVEQVVPLNCSVQNKVMIENIISAPDFNGRIDAFMKAYMPQYISKINSSTSKTENQYMISEILRQKGNVKICELADYMGYSERHFNRMFTERLGISPKKFCRIIRFQNILQEFEEKGIENYQLFDINEIGYFDEAHFIHDFKTFCGKSPIKFIREIKNEHIMERLRFV